MEMRIVEMVGGVSECVDFKLLEKILRNLGEEPVNYHASFNSTLRVENKNNSIDVGVV